MYHPALQGGTFSRHLRLQHVRSASGAPLRQATAHSCIMVCVDQALPGRGVSEEEGMCVR